MALEKQGRLVDALLKKTRSSQIDWKQTGDENAFQVSFKANSVLITRIARGQSEDVDYKISLINDTGTVAEQFTDVELYQDLGNPKDEPDKWYKTMGTLFELARRTALGSDKLLDEILGEIDDER